MKHFDYKKIKAMKGNCGMIREGCTEDVGFARADMFKGLSTPHYHKKLIEYYLVVEGEGILRVKTKQKIEEIKLHPDVIVRIEPGEIHQTKTSKKLVLEAITRPVWVDSDEIPVEKGLF